MTVGALIIRVERAERDINETHSRIRETVTNTDQLTLRSDDCRRRVQALEDNQRAFMATHADLDQRMNLLETKLDDMRLNLTKVVEGQLDILNSNNLTREQFSSVLAVQDKQHATKTKRLRTIVAVSGGLLFLASQVYAKYVGESTALDALMRFIGITPA